MMRRRRETRTRVQATKWMLLLGVLLLGIVSTRSALAATVAGTVTDPSATPIADTEVAFVVSGTQQQVASQFTDASGTYTATVADGTYDVRVTPPEDTGFLPQSIEEVVIGGDTTLNVVLVPAQPVRFSGTLVDGDGLPIAAQRVRLRQGNLYVESITDAQGAFTMQVAPGAYRVFVGSNGYAPNAPSSYYYVDEQTARTIAADTTVTLTVPTHVITGTVVDPDGNPVANATVQDNSCANLYDPATTTAYTQCASSTSTDAQGHFTFTLLPLTFQLQATPPSGSPLAPTAVSVEAGNDPTPVIVLPTPVTFSGTLVDGDGLPIAAQRVRLRQGNLYVESSTDVQGAFALQVAPGAYRVFVGSNGYAPNAPSSYYYVDEQTARTIAADTTVTLTVPTHVITGTVVDPDGNPVANATVQDNSCANLYDPATTTAYTQCASSTSTDAQGHFTFTLLPLTFQLQATPPSGSPLAPTAVSVEAGNDPTPVIVLPTPVTFSGTLVDGDGLPIAAQRVRLRQGNLYVESSTDVQGAFTMQVAPGAYRVFVGSNGYAPNAPSSYYYVDEQTARTIAADTTVTLTVPTHVITGTVVDPDGNPVANATVQDNSCANLYDPATTTAYTQCASSTSTDAQGHFTFTLLPLTFQLQVTPAPDSGFVSFALSNINGATDQLLAILLQFRREAVDEEPVPPGGTVSTDPENDGATFADPVETYVTVPGDQSRIVTIDETPITVTPPAEYRFLTQQVEIDIVPANATITAPFVLKFRLDASRVPAGQDETTVQLFRNGILVSECAGAPGVASPNPCVSLRELLADGDIQLTALTSRASSWNFGTELPPSDIDADGVPDALDNCPTPNPDQADRDDDGVGDVCDACPDDSAKAVPGTCGCGAPETDDDGDGAPNCVDNCVDTANVGQADADDDGVGDACDGCAQDAAKTAPGLCGCGSVDITTDGDGDSVIDCQDNCPGTPNPDQSDANGDHIGDVCDPCFVDTDGDGVVNCEDNCPTTANPAQSDGDDDGTGDACDACADDPTKVVPGVCGCGAAEAISDADGDHIAECLDNCPNVANPDQGDANHDGVGDLCEPCSVGGTPLTMHLRGRVIDGPHGDQLVLQGRSTETVPFTELMTTDPGVSLTNGAGLDFDESVMRGAGKTGRYRFVFVDPAAKARRQGIARILMVAKPGHGFALRVRAYGDLSKASADMELAIRLGSHCFAPVGHWSARGDGWRLSPR